MDASLNANPRFLLEDEVVEVATVAAEVVVEAATGVVEALVERVVGVTTGATEVYFTASTMGEVVEGLGAALLEAIWVLVAGVCWMKTAWLESEEEDAEAEEVVAGAALVEVAEGLAEAAPVKRTGVPSMVPVPTTTGTPVW